MNIGDRVRILEVDDKIVHIHRVGKTGIVVNMDKYNNILVQDDYEVVTWCKSVEIIYQLPEELFTI